MRFLVCSLLVLAEVSCTSDPSMIIAENSDLNIKQEVKSTLSLHKADTFQLNLRKNAFVTGFANQISADVVVIVLGPDKKELGRFDEPARGPELFQFSTGESGLYKIIVSPYQENTGDYTLVLTSAEPTATDPLKRIDQLANAMISEDGPGASIAVVKDGKITYSKGFGHANLEYDIHNTPQTVFHIASISKQVTAFAIALLVDQGKLSLSDDIRKYLPEMHDFRQRITIDHLVHHTSGLRDQWNLLALAGWRLDDVITQKQIMRVITKQRELNFKPGEQMLYCNTGFTLMAEIVSRVTGQSFADWTHANIFEPLGMKNTLFYDDHEKVVNNRAYSYHESTAGFKKSVLSYANAGATSLFTTVEDLSLWAMNFENIRVGNEHVMAMMNQRFILNNGDTISYAFGQDIQLYKGLKTYSHGGADAGYRTFLLRIPDQHFSVAVFSNLASFNPGGLCYRIAESYLADKLIEEKPKENETTSPPAEVKEPFDAAKVNLSEFIGKFYSPELETHYTFLVERDTLRARHQRHDDIILTPVKTDGFRSSAWFMGEVEFIRDKSKNVNGLKAGSGRVKGLVFEKQ